MIVHDRTSQFGWPGDNGVGAQLIGEIIAGIKTATCAPKEQYGEGELADLHAGIGQLATVIDKDGNPHCTIRLRAVYETTFGQPNPRLVRGEGDGEDVDRFKRDHRAAWGDEVAPGLPLTDDTVLIVEEFDLVEVAGGPGPIGRHS